MNEYTRKPLKVTAVKYEFDKGIEDGYEQWSKLVTNGWISTEKLLQRTREDDTVVCPFIQGKRGITFIRKGDYIITELDGDRHVCGGDKFNDRFDPA